MFGESMVHLFSLLQIRRAQPDKRTLCKGGAALILLARERWFCSLPSSHSSKSAGERSGPTGTLKLESHGTFVRQGNVAEWSKALAVETNHVEGVGSNPTTAHRVFCTLTKRTTGMEDGQNRTAWLGRLG